MDSKTKKILTSEFIVANNTDKTLAKAISDCAQADFDRAITLWEFTFEYYAIEYLGSATAREAMTTMTFDKLVEVNKQRAFKAVTENAVIKKNLCANCDTTLSESFVEMTASYIVSQKVEIFTEIAKLLSKNSYFSDGYGVFFKKIMERAFELIGAKNGKVTLTNKQTEGLLACIKLITTSEKPLLEQRIREVRNSPLPQ